MEHSTAIMEDAGRDIDKSAAAATNKPVDIESIEQSKTANEDGNGTSSRPNKHNDRKRKAEYKDYSIRQGSKKGGRRGDGPDDNKRHKKGDMGRTEYFRSNPDKRAKTQNGAQSRNEDGNAYGPGFSKEEINAEERRPKRKVAVFVGYSGTGYKGMQISPSQRTIEGDLFQAFVKAGAISKANADDPKKASLVRCARTDKGVHAAGNMISLKLIIEDEKIVEKINAELSEQIRVWGIVRTTGAFSCYQSCDSRWYEYLIPSYAFLPPHPSSYLAKQLELLADEAGDREGYEARQAEVKGFWEAVDERDIKPVLESIDEDIRWDVVKALQGEDEASAKAARFDADLDEASNPAKSRKGRNDDETEGAEDAEGETEVTEEAAIIIREPVNESGGDDNSTGTLLAKVPTNEEEIPSTMVDSAISLPNQDQGKAEGDGRVAEPTPEEIRIQRLRAATKTLRQAYMAAKRRYRIPKARIERIQAALNKYTGTKNYHNYTVRVTFQDPSAKRHILSFVANPKPILIGDGEDANKTEWLSLKVHGQSFMMHQIRKMIGMVSILVRSGGDLSTMDESFGASRFSIPKVPGLGLMLERPVFNNYNTKTAPQNEREPLDFSKYEEEIEEFKHREIYARMFREEERMGEFARYFNHVDNFREPFFLYVSSKGLEATRGASYKRIGDGNTAVDL